MMSTDYLQPDDLRKVQNRLFFPGAAGDTPWTDTESYTRFYVALPMYPFRTLSPRSTALLQTGKLSTSTSLSGGGGSGMDFEYASCLLPAHTQCTIHLKRRPNGTSLLNFFYIWDTLAARGTLSETLTQEQRDQVLSFVQGTRGAGANRQNVNAKIINVTISIADMSLLVGFTPPPLPL